MKSSNKRANRLAHRLRKPGGNAETLVPLITTLDRNGLLLSLRLKTGRRLHDAIDPTVPGSSPEFDVRGRG